MKFQYYIPTYKIQSPIKVNDSQTVVNLYLDSEYKMRFETNEVEKYIVL